MQDVHWPQADCCPDTAETAAKSIGSGSLIFGDGNLCVSIKEGLGCTTRFGSLTNRSERGKLNLYFYKAFSEMLSLVSVWEHHGPVSKIRKP